MCYIIIMEQTKTKWQSFWELVRFALIALAIVIPVRVLVAEPFIVSGSSMVPTFENGDYLIVDKISYKLSSPQRGDVVVFRYPGDTTKFFIKRIIGLPNEIVDIKGNKVTITNENYKEGFVLDQPFVKNPANNDTHFELKSDEYFILGDNRSASSDSRYWGAVKENLLAGRAFLRLLPINKIGILPGNYKQADPQQ
ncbi:MAG: Signal peptidase I [Candidatus Nomurabacteria bacterium GW2011_GWB1_40_7]|uniref:Signal peptidase I n=1 Tax=Candidatus Nomurabacteria bacterium GW2011_GWB1_40_7 TaxID=1618744 RepID=A0A0G0SYC5_9BACT|nr:MAG: Signal peptidase I [Candidatus Nomurabacteria bacterium GW2011_GWB1_40_7]